LWWRLKIDRIGAAISPEKDRPWHLIEQGLERVIVFPSMTVISTGAPASASAAFRPPKLVPQLPRDAQVGVRRMVQSCCSLSYSIRFTAMAIGSRTSAADLDPAWVRWLVPSIADLLFVAIGWGYWCSQSLSVRVCWGTPESAGIFAPAN